MSEETKKCPYCDGEILSTAIKCKHCREFLNQNGDLACKKQWYRKTSFQLFACCIALVIMLATTMGAFGQARLLWGASKDYNEALAKDERLTQKFLDEMPKAIEKRKQEIMAAGGIENYAKELSRKKLERLKSPETSLPGDQSLPRKTAREVPLKIKGFYIGMDINDAHKLLKEYLTTENWDFTDVATGDHEIVCAFSEPNDYLFLVFEPSISSIYTVQLESGRQIPKPVGIVTAGPDEKVIGIGFDPIIVDSLFKAKDMEASDFREQFTSAYNIPEMELSDDLGWWFAYNDGVKIQISSEKTLVLKKVPNAMERRVAFN